MRRKIGILMFDKVNELDFIGPYEVFTNSAYLSNMPIFPDHVEIAPNDLDVALIAKKRGIVTCEKGLRVDIPVSIGECGSLDVLIVPGGSGVESVIANAEQMAWIRRISEGCQWVTSVCNGTFVLAAAGLAKDHRVTTHWAALDNLRQTGQTGPVLEDVQYVRDGNLVCSAGVSAGIDMSLWLLGQITTPSRARLVQRIMQYNPAPPYAAEV